ncbi:MAG: haloacid dehalogenase type II [Candidatus Bathyarchaeia archaeon]
MLSAITFDCYGTLVDWEAGITSFLDQVLREKGTTANIPEVVRAREDIDFEMVQGPYRPYKEILRLSLKETFNRFQVAYNDQDGERLIQSVPTWPVFEETRPALDRLARKYPLAIISNIDKDIIEKTKASIGVSFAVTVTAQEAGAYKPTLTPFQLALKKLSLKATNILHVSSGFRYDVPPARRLGFRTAWVNRKSEQAPSNQRADHEFGDLTELADFVENSTS